MKNPFTPILARQRAVLFDGGLATALERRGANLSSHLWSAKLIADEPERIIDVHLSHLRAGADVISSASYQASRLGFAKVGMSAADAYAGLQRAGVLGPGGAAVAGGSTGMAAAGVGSVASSACVARAISATALSNAAWLAREGVR